MAPRCVALVADTTTVSAPRAPRDPSIWIPATPEQHPILTTKPSPRPVEPPRSTRGWTSMHPALGRDGDDRVDLFRPTSPVDHRRAPDGAIPTAARCCD